MMYCLHSYIPLLLLPLPLSLSPVHLTLLLVLTYVLNRPCIYCSFLLLILFASSCHWSGRCFNDFDQTSADGKPLGIAGWFLPRLYASTTRASEILEPQQPDRSVVGFLATITNNTVMSLASAGLETAKTGLTRTPDEFISSASKVASLGSGWIRSLLGKSEWTLPCVDIKIAI